MEQIITILHVDDDVLFLNAVQRYLRKQPYKIISTNKISEALFLAQKIDFGLIILDVSMPEMGGFRLLEALRTTHPETPVIMLTGLTDSYVHYKSILAGCDGYLEKPCHPDRLIKEIQFVLSLKQVTNRNSYNKAFLYKIQEDAV